MKTNPKTEPLDLATESPDVGLAGVPEDGIGGRIRSAREAKGWTQTTLANMTKEIDPHRKGVSRTVLVGYESGQFKPGAREIRILCETLSLTPNWLIYGDDFAGGTEQTAMEVTRKNGLFAAMRLALAVAVLKPHERAGFQSLVLSMAGRELGDRKLSILFALAASLAMPGFDLLAKELNDPDLMSRDIQDVIKRVLELSDGAFIEWGNNLKFGPNGEVSGEWLYPEPGKSI